MRVLPVCSFKNYNKATKQTLNVSCSNTVSFKSEQTLFKSALSKLRKITLSEYKILTAEEKQVLKAEIAKIKSFATGEIVINEDTRMHHYLSEAIRQCFDREYGIGKYVVIAIGRSLSSVSKLLGMKIGEQNVKNIPMSNLSNYDERSTQMLEEWCTPQYRKYLESIGLSRNIIENSGKNYVIIDYAFTGKSLKNAYKLLVSDYYLGNRKRNITAVAAQELLPLRFSIERTNLATDLQRSAYKVYSFVDKLRANDIKPVAQTVDYEKFCISDVQLKNRKLFGFNLLDSVYGPEKNRQYNDLEFNFSSRAYPNQRKKFWLNETQQFKKDLFEDRYELEKALRRISGDREKQMEIEKLQAKLKSDPTPLFYYNTLRPQILKIIEEV